MPQENGIGPAAKRAHHGAGQHPVTPRRQRERHEKQRGEEGAQDDPGIELRRAGVGQPLRPHPFLAGQPRHPEGEQREHPPRSADRATDAQPHPGAVQLRAPKPHSEPRRVGRRPDLQVRPCVHVRDQPRPRQPAEHSGDKQHRPAPLAEHQVHRQHHVERHLDAQRPHLCQPRHQTVRDVDLHHEQVGQGLPPTHVGQRRQRRHDHAHAHQVGGDDAGGAVEGVRR